MPTIPKATRPPWMPRREAQGRRKESNYSFYNSTTWRKNRLAYIQQHPICVLCRADGITVPATVVDHITPINQGGSSMDWNNLQSLCDHHHAVKSGREAHGSKGRGTEHP